MAKQQQTYWIGPREVTRAQFYAHTGRYRSAPLARGRTARARKASVLASRPLAACWHDYSYREDWIGDAGVINGTMTIRWLECEHCGAKKEASYEDRPSYDDWYA